MAIKNLPGYVWLYPDKANPYGVTVDTRKAYNPLSGDMLSVREAQTMQHGGLSYEQRQFLADERGNGIVRDYIRTKAEQNQFLTEVTTMHDAEFKQLLRDLRSEKGKQKDDTV